MKPIHPILVHFPLALLPMSVAADVLTAYAGIESLRSVGWWSLLVAALSTLLVVPAGLFDMHRATLSESVHLRVHRHMHVGIALVVAIWTLLFWRGTLFANGLEVSWLYLVVALSAVALALLQGWLGGELVYTDAVSVQATHTAHDAANTSEPKGGHPMEHQKMQHAEQAHQHGNDGRMEGGHYGRLLAMVVLSFLAMYALMYAMVDTFDNVLANVNQFYMAGLMAAPMLLIELALMSSMYRNRRFNVVLALVAVGAMVLFWIGIRQQAAVSDQQFLRSMIPHHGAAILMCKQNRLQDPELQQLCREIMSSQQSEVDLMKKKLR